jgi:hypothetical protein
MFWPNNKKSRGGYIALTSAIILVLIVMAVAIAFGNSNFLGRFDSLGLEQKDVSKEAAQGCLEYARLKLKLGPYSGNETIAVGSSTCTVLSIQSSGPNFIIQSTSNEGGHTSNLELTVVSTTLTTVSLTEKGHF